ncbi:nucleotidyltransferase family protein [Rhodopseudomonas palustris]|uniref:Nucleotidyltransferase family protein n=1 Tax=Rhodopseudomonas palustris (strain ATCC BAA-98 / CGA009) TaxID=258594 RepID=Q6N2X9_RHOPA|nr:nucleotidyltransferase family protein [Rhodopseudomonas palustris]OPF92660.1 mannose-1-phosphate guanyltransferase [Rhodopseudomonas palustris]PPQ43365.1 mannose-1-phosphate guanyltransferase [Rhodopseudomonas palustris]QQM05478.1 UTP--glucose-1-phosphate uridylyltransferase [Rhodopseudomonas palustris]RJF63239.1 nucleotidyltransferase family protein [Rhodopseudomonas palustris]WAB76816.1 nucleotidyltransferase family protein [Rhodopseudomonas palustris]
MSGGAKALLVAAGLGTRLAPLTDVLPKCLMPIAGHPLLGLWLRMLSEAGFSEIVVNLHHHADLVSEYIRRSPWAERVILAPETTLLGTAGTLLRHCGRFSDGPTLFAHADNLSLFDPRAFLAAHAGRPPDTAMTMMSFVTDHPQSCGILTLDPAGRVLEMDEKPQHPKGNLANAAVYIVEPEVIDFIASLGKPVVDFSTEVLPVFMGRIFSFHNGSYHRDIGNPSSLALAQLDYPLAVLASPRHHEEVQPAKQSSPVHGAPELLRLPLAMTATSRDDPWFGLMTDNNVALAIAFAQAAAKTYGSRR